MIPPSMTQYSVVIVAHKFLQYYSGGGNFVRRFVWHYGQFLKITNFKHKVKGKLSWAVNLKKAA